MGSMFNALCVVLDICLCLNVVTYIKKVILSQGPKNDLQSRLTIGEAGARMGRTVAACITLYRSSKDEKGLRTFFQAIANTVPSTLLEFHRVFGAIVSPIIFGPSFLK